MRVFRHWVVWSVVLWAFLLSGPAVGEVGRAAHGLLYQISSPTAAVSSVLFGTIHSEDPRATELPPPVRAAFDDCSGVALEVIPDAAAIIKAMVTMTYTDGRTLHEVLPPDLYPQTAAALADIGMSEDAFKDFKPWAVMTLLSTPPTETGHFLDIMLYRAALESGRPVQGLETMEEQLAVFDGMSEADQIGLLRETLKSRSQLPIMFEQLMQVYLERDLGRLVDLSESSLQGGDPRLAELFREVVIDARNRRMVERMRPLLDRGGWFIAIGALHLPGDAGVIALLRRLGYGVSVLY
ncbi:TraB/GumN family protein [Thiocystis minor]|uniref:TraB/GumN family protein n=1 Tax=Thiocystis minor TaxID=61597 RepID=UPI001F5D332D|nr:TraB/GumN family protein [Thiocystis minor]